MPVSLLVIASTMPLVAPKVTRTRLFSSKSSSPVASDRLTRVVVVLAVRLRKYVATPIGGKLALNMTRNTPSESGEL